MAAPRQSLPRFNVCGMARRALFALLVWAIPAQADFDPDAYPRHETCALCHGLFGVSHTAKFPHLGGQDPVYIEAQLRAFLAGTRSNDGGQMAAIVNELQTGDIDQVVGWFSTQDPPAPSGDGSETGAALYKQAGCGGCHDVAGQLDGVPFLSAQHAGYLAKQMRDFRDGARGMGPLTVPHGELIPGLDADIDAIATYLAATARE